MSSDEKYEIEKKKIQEMNLPTEEYEKAIKALAQRMLF
jgi:hypothetical protein